ncbi:MAG: hypothetical protein JNL79_29985 [Myxococcales bacterium]|nr:hypothetical protein [Myxococcales bacterium]
MKLDTSDFAGRDWEFESSVSPADAATVLELVRSLPHVERLDDVGIRGVLFVTKDEGVGLSMHCNVVSWWKGGVTTYLAGNCGLARAMVRFLPVSQKDKALLACACE